MHDATARALTVILWGLSGVLLFAAASAWAKVAKVRERSNERPEVRVSELRYAAGISAAALALLGITALWLALLSLPSSS